MVLVASTLPDALRCERCGQKNEILGHRSGGGLCVCCV
jgi:hypothetical protein